MTKFKIIKTNKGIANRYPNYIIEVNKKLYQTEYKPLLQEILLHEKLHTDNSFTFHDLFLDLLGFRNKILYWKFIFTTPNSWWQFLPIYKSSFGTWFFDISVFLFWAIIALSIGIVGGYIYG